MTSKHPVDTFIELHCRAGAKYPDDFDMESLEKARAICDEPVKMPPRKDLHCKRCGKKFLYLLPAQKARFESDPDGDKFLNYYHVVDVPLEDSA